MQRKGGSDLRNRELDVMNEIDIIESKKIPKLQKDVCFWLSGLTKHQCDEFCKSHTPRHSQEKRPTTNADEKNLFSS